MRGRPVAAVIVAANLISSLALRAQAQDQYSRADAIREERRKVLSEITGLSESGKQLHSAESKSTIDEALIGLRSLDALYAQEEAWTEEKASLEGRLAHEKKELNALENFTPDEPRPYSFLLLEHSKTTWPPKRTMSAP